LVFVFVLVLAPTAAEPLTSPKVRSVSSNSTVWSRVPGGAGVPAVVVIGSLTVDA
jgi:hypothetical protein